MNSSGAIVKEGMKRSQKSYWWRQKEASACATPPPKPGNCCPTCGEGILAYDGLFVLTCSHCGKAAESGAFT
jgi:ribosomal protein L37AE/L43A